MSRKSDLRTAIRDELDTRLAGHDVDEVKIPDYDNEELKDGPRVYVRDGVRTIEVEQGPDARIVTVVVGIAGSYKPMEGPQVKKTDYRAQQLAESDAFDDLAEQIIGFWSPDGPLSRCDIAEHRFQGLEESVDLQRLFTNNLHIGELTLSYYDTLDD